MNFLLRLLLLVYVSCPQKKIHFFIFFPLIFSFKQRPHHRHPLKRQQRQPKGEDQTLVQVVVSSVVMVLRGCSLLCRCFCWCWALVSTRCSFEKKPHLLSQQQQEVTPCAWQTAMQRVLLLTLLTLLRVLVQECLALNLRMLVRVLG